MTGRDDDCHRITDEDRGLAVALSFKYGRHRRPIPREDADSIATLALLVAAGRYRPGRAGGTSFASYATPWIKGAILRSAGDWWDHDSLDAPAELGDGTTGPLAWYVVDDHDEPPFEFDVLQGLPEKLLQLDARARDVIAARFGLGGREHETLEAIGARYGVTKEAIRQIESRAIDKLRDLYGIPQERSAGKTWNEGRATNFNRKAAS